MRELSDKEFFASLPKLGKEMDDAENARWELELRHQMATRKLLAMQFGAQMQILAGGTGGNTDGLLKWARWAYKEAIGEEWPSNRGPDLEE